MTKLYVTEYTTIAVLYGHDVVQTPQEPPLVEQVIDYTAGVASSAPFNAKTTLVRLHTDAVCSVLIGTSPTAATTNQRMAANQTEYKSVAPGFYKVSAITNT